jgi:toxin YoeB
MYKITYSRQAQKDAKRVKGNKNLKNKIQSLVNIISKNPYQTPPFYKKLIGDLDEMYSRRINIQHRLVYMVFENEKTIKIAKMWGHYE